MGQKYLLDSNTIIDYTSNYLPPLGNKIIDEIINDHFIISIIVKIEVLGFNGNSESMLRLERFLDFAQVIMLSEAIAHKTIDLRKKYRKLGLGDAIIAATALVNNLTVITRNLKDFQGIENIKAISPYEM